jgi:serine protease Do
MAIAMRLNGLAMSGLALMGSWACMGTSVPASTLKEPLGNNQQTQSPQLHSFAFTQNELQVLMADDNWGSGILIQRQGQTYTVLTNQHVLWIGDRFSIQTSDGKQYTASRDTATKFGKDDLGILRFTSQSKQYPVVPLGCSTTLKAGNPVYAAGFPLPLTEASTKGFKFTSGSISLISPKAFEGGYQIGYSNDIEKGMSGGPVLNKKGELIAVNGMHQEPLWGDPYVFQDGSKPKSSLFNLLSHSSWAIPVETVLRTTTLKAIQPSQCKALK